MATSKNQTQAIVGDFARVVVWLFADRRHCRCGIRLEFFREPGPAADAVDSFVPSRLDDPGARRVRDARCGPLIDRSRKGFLSRLFGYVEVANELNQRGDDSAP